MPQVSYRLSDKYKRLIENLASELEMSETDVIKLAVSQFEDRSKKTMLQHDYMFSAAILLSTQKKAVKETAGGYIITAWYTGNEEEIKLTIQRGDQKPHVEEAFKDLSSCIAFLADKGLDGPSWMPFEDESEDKETIIVSSKTGGGRAIDTETDEDTGVSYLSSPWK